MQFQDNEKWPRGYLAAYVAKVNGGVSTRALRRRCGVCERVYCVCPRRQIALVECGWVQPGKNVGPVPPRPPRPMPPVKRGGK
jgi:hypothetical protein